jgi:hypothetical protein
MSRIQTAAGLPLILAVGEGIHLIEIQGFHIFLYSFSIASILLVGYAAQ